MAVDASVKHLEFSNEGFLVSNYSDGVFVSWSINGQVIRHSRLRNDSINSMKINTEGNFLIMGGQSGEVRVWDAFNLEPLRTFPQCDTSINDLALTHDQKYIITAMQSGSVVAFRVDFNKFKDVLH